MFIVLFVNVLMHHQTPQCNIWGKHGEIKLQLAASNMLPKKIKMYVLRFSFLFLFGQYILQIQSAKKIKKKKKKKRKNQWLTLLMLSHLVPHPAWKTCLQGRVIRLSPLLYSIWQITHLGQNNKIRFTSTMSWPRDKEREGNPNQYKLQILGI